MLSINWVRFGFGVVRRNDDRAARRHLLSYEEPDDCVHRLESVHSGDLLRADGSDADTIARVVDAVHLAGVAGRGVRGPGDVVDAFSARQLARAGFDHGPRG